MTAPLVHHWLCSPASDRRAKFDSQRTTVVEVSIVGYPEIVRAELDIPDELSILCGLAVGYTDPDFAANKLKIGRKLVGENAVFLDS
jgi:hypothetical protein